MPAQVKKRNKKSTNRPQNSPYRDFNCSPFDVYHRLSDVDSKGKPIRQPNGMPPAAYVRKVLAEALETHRIYMSEHHPYGRQNGYSASRFDADGNLILDSHDTGEG